jgi:hypothetical protein
MSFNRRQFLVGLASSAFASVYARATAFVLENEAPLLIPPRTTFKKLYYEEMGSTGYYLFDGPPWGHWDCGPSDMTIQEFINSFCGGDLSHYRDVFNFCDRINLNDLVDWSADNCIEAWAESYDPAKLAYRSLQQLDLAADSKQPNAGELRWNDVYENVEVLDDLSLSLLQQRLNDLGTGISLVSGHEYSSTAMTMEA